MSAGMDRCAKSSPPTRIRRRDCLRRGESLYRLSHPGSPRRLWRLVLIQICESKFVAVLFSSVGFQNSVACEEDVRKPRLKLKVPVIASLRAKLFSLQQTAVSFSALKYVHPETLQAADVSWKQLEGGWGCSVTFVPLFKFVPITSAATCRSTVTVHSSSICNKRQKDIQTTNRLFSLINKK